MKFFGKIGIILLLITTAGVAESNNVGQKITGIISNSSIASTLIIPTNTTSTTGDDEDDDNDTIYVCGNDVSDKICTCENEELNCYTALWTKTSTSNSVFKIKIRKENFTAKIVDLRYNGLNIIRKDEILAGQESKVKKLYLYNNGLRRIEDATFDKFTSLTTLGLGYNSLTSMNDTILTKQLGSTLEELDLPSNNLQNLTTTVFQHLIKLTFLNLQGNSNINVISKINGINVTIFPEALSNLKLLSLSFCNIKNFDDNVFINLRSLEYLDISGNPVTTLPAAIKILPTLRTLKLEFSKIVSIDDCDFCGFSNLKVLNLGLSRSLTYIHENAFGALNNGSTVLPQLELFSVMLTNISVLHEKLLNWENVSKIWILHTPLACNCSMAWLINDYNATKPIYVDKLKDNKDKAIKNDLKCQTPPALKGTHLHTLAGNFCMNDILAEKQEEDIYYICDDNDVGEDEDTKIYKGCSCEADYVNCAPSSNKLNHTNIKILKSNFTFERAGFVYNNITTLKKDKFLPGYEHLVKILILYANNISNIENGTFDKFINLQGLNLSNNNLSTAIVNVTFPSSLQEIYLRNTNLQRIPTNNFANITHMDLSENPNIFSTKMIFQKSYLNLQILSLSSCRIKKLEENVFENLKSLKTLELDKNLLTAIPSAINLLPSLRSLDISSSNITVLQRNGIKLHYNLTKIIAGASVIKRIDDCAFCNFPNLKEIDLSNNLQLSYIHENAFGAVSNQKPLQIKEFSIENCKISTLSEKLLDWKNVSTIDIQYNRFTCNCSLAWLINDYYSTKPLYVHNLKYYNWWDTKSLKNELYCTNPPELKGEYFYKLSGDFCLNKNTVIEEKKVYHVCGENAEEADSVCICKNDTIECSFLQHANVEISSNKTIEIKNVEIVIGNLSVLNLSKFLAGKVATIESLELRRNKIEIIENGTFDKFTSLKTVDLSSNHLTTIDENVLTKQLGLTLTELHLTSNNLMKISSASFMHMTELEILDLSYNPKLCNALNSNPFPIALSNLKTLFLVECNITILNDDIFINLSKLKFLHLSDNPLSTFPTAINALTNLYLLDLDRTKITVLNKDGVKMNKNLQEFHLAHSTLQRIENCAFCSFPNLKEIHFNYNKNLSFIHENAFGFAHSHTTPVMEKIWLAYCNLTFIPEQLLNWDEKHITIGANGNPFTCDCAMNWWIKDFKDKHHNTSIRHFYKCQNPTEYRLKIFTEIPDLQCNKILVNSTTTRLSTTTAPSTITEAYQSSTFSHWMLILLILTALIVITLIIVVGGIYYYRKRKIFQTRTNGNDEGEEDLLEEDFDVENV